eukprot:4526202-Prymnesium_polylepis.1
MGVQRVRPPDMLLCSSRARGGGRGGTRPSQPASVGPLPNVTSDNGAELSSKLWALAECGALKLIGGVVSHHLDRAPYDLLDRTDPELHHLDILVARRGVIGRRAASVHICANSCGTTCKRCRCGILWPCVATVVAVLRQPVVPHGATKRRGLNEGAAGMDPI